MYYRSYIVRPWRGNWYGYPFRFIPNETSRKAFLDAFKAAVPLKTWDPQSKVWWVPDLYRHTADSVALEHGALTEKDLADSKVAFSEEALPALITLGLAFSPNLPLALVKRVMAFWETELGAFPTQALELEKKREAYAVVLAQYGETP